MKDFFNIRKLFESSKEDSDILYDLFSQIRNNQKHDFEKNIVKNIKRLSKNNPQLLNGIDESGNTILHYAAHFGYDNIVSLLLTSGGDWNLKNHMGQTPIFRTVINNKYTTFTILNKYPVVYNDTDNAGNTLLHYAVRKSNVNIISELVNKNANQKIKNNESKIPLYYVNLYKKETIKSINVFFSNSGLDENLILDDEGNNIAHLAVKMKNYDLLKELLVHKNFRTLFLQLNKDILTPLFLAAKCHDEKAYRMILLQADNTFFNQKLNIFYNFIDAIESMSENTIIDLFSQKKVNKDLNNYKDGFSYELLALAKKNHIAAINYITSNFKLSSTVDNVVYENLLFTLLEKNQKELFDKLTLHYKGINHSFFLNGFKYFLSNKKNTLVSENIDGHISFLMRKQKIFLQRAKETDHEKNINDCLNFLNFLLENNNRSLFIEMILIYLDIGISFKNISTQQYIENGSILHKAIKINDLNIVQKISLLGINVDIEDSSNQSAIELAILNENYEIFEFLSYRTKKLDSPEPSFTLLETCIKNDYFTGFSHLISLTDIKNCVYNGIDILEYCIRENKIDYVKKLAFSGIFLRNKSYSGHSNILSQKLQNSFYLAAEKDFIDIFIFLYNEGAGVNMIPEKQTYTPLQICIVNDSEKCFDFLLKNQADVNKLSDITSESPLHVAVKHQRLNMVKKLVEKGANMENRSNIKKMTPLDYSILNNNTDISEFLIQNGAIKKKQS